MLNLLSKYLTKLVITREQLDAKPIIPGQLSEKEQFEKWNKILSEEEEVSVKKIEEFCQSEINKIEARWQDLDNITLKNERLIIAHTIYRNILRAIKEPKVEREVLENYLNQLVI